MLLLFKAPPLGNVIQVGVIRSARGSARADQVKAEFVFDEGPPLRTSMLAYNVKDKRAALINLPIAEFARLKQAKVLSIRSKGALNERFALSAIDPLMKVMNDCVRNLREVWNVTDGGVPGGKLKEAVAGSIQGLIKSQDYPAVSIHEDQSGTVAVALLIDEQGKVADCTVVATSGAAALDAQTCAMLKERAKLKPAIGLAADRPRVVSISA